ncbi:heptaprenyl diphosphate synthase component 1 [Paenibacillus tuaregi]|uniref:heptaprenyl diphosphate synthase component 1 n=1 Tax=Paenibacillus tuaregi TaxID=1816681 RepID=UPI0008382ADC|nr:heptaprenyl diphosphate synthase component 1 [Paenibacillus tuaregi]
MKPYRIPELAKKYVEYDMITTHTELPPFANARVRLLYTFLRNQDSFTEAAAENIALAVYLVQLGLDTHDLIDAEPVRKEEREMRSRQLNVLAGDFFSSSFYELLAKEGRIDLISALSSAVCEVNRKKVNLYTKMRTRLTADEFLEAKIELNKELFLTFNALLDKPLRHSWELLLHEISCCEAAAFILDKMASSQSGIDDYTFLYISEHGTAEEQAALARPEAGVELKKRLIAKYGLVERIWQTLHHSVTRFQLILQDVQTGTVHQEEANLISPFLTTLQQLKPAL